MTSSFSYQGIIKLLITYIYTFNDAWNYYILDLFKKNMSLINNMDQCCIWEISRCGITSEILFHQTKLLRLGHTTNVWGCTGHRTQIIVIRAQERINIYESKRKYFKFTINRELLYRKPKLDLLRYKYLRIEITTKSK